MQPDGGTIILIVGGRKSIVFSSPQLNNTSGTRVVLAAFVFDISSNSNACSASLGLPCSNNPCAIL